VRPCTELRNDWGCRLFRNHVWSDGPEVAARAVGKVTEALVASLVLGVTTPAATEFACKPALTFKDVRFSNAQKWTATLTGDASRCAATTGQFEIRFVGLKEFGRTWSSPKFS
jgi:hypothetical protein